MKHKIAISVDSSLIEKVDKLAKKLGLSRSQFIENLIAVGLEDAELFEKFKVLSIVTRIRDLVSELNKLKALEKTAKKGVIS